MALVLWLPLSNILRNSFTLDKNSLNALWYTQLRDELLSVLKSRGVDIFHQLLLDTTSLTNIHIHQLFVRNKDLILFAVQPFTKL